MKKRKVPMRKCVACQEVKPKKSLIRIVRTPNSETLIDPTGKSRVGVRICVHVRNVLYWLKRNRHWTERSR